MLPQLIPMQMHKKPCHESLHTKYFCEYIIVGNFNGSDHFTSLQVIIFFRSCSRQAMKISEMDPCGFLNVAYYNCGIKGC